MFIRKLLSEKGPVGGAVGLNTTNQNQLNYFTDMLPGMWLIEQISVRIVHELWQEGIRI